MFRSLYDDNVWVCFRLRPNLPLSVCVFIDMGFEVRALPFVFRVPRMNMCPCLVI